MVITDKRVSKCDSELAIEYFEVEVLSAMDYYPFGMMMPDRQYYANNDSSSYSFGFNGMERDNEISGQGNNLDFGARIYDSRLGRWLSVDPSGSNFPFESHYCIVSNNAIIYIDYKGYSKYKITQTINESTGTVQIEKVLIDEDILERVTESVPSWLDPHDFTHNYKYYDINEIHTKIVKKDGTVEKTVKNERGEFRVESGIKSQRWANFLKTENKWEDAGAGKMYGIMFTSLSNLAGGKFDEDKMIEFSTNIDLLMAAISSVRLASNSQGAFNELLKAKKIPEGVSAAVDILIIGETLTNYVESLKPSPSVSEEPVSNPSPIKGPIINEISRTNTPQRVGRDSVEVTGTTASGDTAVEQKPMQTKPTPKKK